MPSLPPLYKYLDVNGAKLTLGNGTFRHAKPSDFNDVEDMTVQSLFPEEVEEALKALSEAFPLFILENVNRTPTCSPRLAEKVRLLQEVFKAKQEAALAIQELVKSRPELKFFDVEHMRGVSENFLEALNASLQTFRVLCVTTNRDSEHMWENYAQKHAGIVLRIEPNVSKDSKFQLFAPVRYREKRPSIYKNAKNFLDGSLFGDQEQAKRAIVESIVYSKTLAWQDEAEYRLAIPLRPGEDWSTLPYHPEEITELYLGAAMTASDKLDICAKAHARNSAMKIFQASRDTNGVLTFSDDSTT